MAVLPTAQPRGTFTLKSSKRESSDNTYFSINLGFGKMTVLYFMNHQEYMHNLTKYII